MVNMKHFDAGGLNEICPHLTCAVPILRVTTKNVIKLSKTKQFIYNQKQKKMV